ncbi:MAG: hypothetical protein FJ088_05570 [Deltaproteobacteria bacterium]|nr:hypothetical protein [Deltaproteobacteria bacterium]
MRLAAAAVCFALAGLMYVNGTAFKEFQSFIILVFYGGAGLYIVSSFKDSVTIKRFAVESILLVAVSLMLLLLFPDIFSLEKQIYQSTIPAPVSRERAVFLDEAKKYCEDVALFMNMEKIENPAIVENLVITTDRGRIKKAFYSIPERERDELLPVYAGINNTHNLFEIILQKQPEYRDQGPKVWSSKSTYDMIISACDKVAAQAKGISKRDAQSEKEIIR